jgi:hypothetical protein
VDRIVVVAEHLVVMPDFDIADTGGVQDGGGGLSAGDAG